MSKKMKDGTTAYLTKSGDYYVSRKPGVKFKSQISYYTLEGERIPLAQGECLDCGGWIESKRCGDWQTCPCERSYVDTDRWSPELHRYGGNIKFK